MREILFRGQAVGSLKWVEGFYFREAGNFIKELPSAVSTETHMVYEDTVGQYTGLTDKNGKKIFEGDIISHFVNGKEFKGVVRYVDGAFGIRCEDGAGQFLCFCNNGEVIGNIHDNPELLKGGEV